MRPQASFVLAGGPVPPLSTPLAALSLHTPRGAYSVDASEPGLPVSFRADACGGVLEASLRTARHLLALRVAAPPASFRPLPCPTATGFRVSGGAQPAPTTRACMCTHGRTHARTRRHTHTLAHTSTHTWTKPHNPFGCSSPKMQPLEAKLAAPPPTACRSSPSPASARRSRPGRPLPSTPRSFPPQ
jgi:hypothetical protein